MIADLNTVNLGQKFEHISSYWDPKIVGELNGQYVKLAKLKGEFIWHHHEEEDELFFVVKGYLQMMFRDRTETVKENEFLIVPKNIEHKPVAKEEVWIMLFEPKTTLNTGTKKNTFTKEKLDHI